MIIEKKNARVVKLPTSFRSQYITGYTAKIEDKILW